MGKYVKRLGIPRSAAGLTFVLALAAVTAFPLFATSQRFTVPADVALRVRLDDTLTKQRWLPAPIPSWTLSKPNRMGRPQHRNSETSHCSARWISS